MSKSRKSRYKYQYHFFIDVVFKFRVTSRKRITWARSKVRESCRKSSADDNHPTLSTKSYHGEIQNPMLPETSAHTSSLLLHYA